MILGFLGECLSVFSQGPTCLSLSPSLSQHPSVFADAVVDFLKKLVTFFFDTCGGKEDKKEVT